MRKELKELYLKIHPLHDRVILPEFATEGSACFDIRCSFYNKSEVTGFSKQNAPFRRPTNPSPMSVGGVIAIMPGDRVMIPTGLVFDIPEKHSVRLYSRSGLSLQKGIVLVNSVGVIDSDFVDEVFVLMTNLSDNPYIMGNDERICQAEMVKEKFYAIQKVATQPTQKTDRKGGFGSTGVSDAQSA